MMYYEILDRSVTCAYKLSVILNNIEIPKIICYAETGKIKYKRMPPDIYFGEYSLEELEKIRQFKAALMLEREWGRHIAFYC